MAKDVNGLLLLLGKGKVSFNQKNADGSYKGELFLGNCPDFSAGISDDRKIKRSSATASAPIIADSLVSRDLTFSITLDEWDRRNVALGLMGALSTLTQTASDGTITLGPVKQGYWYQVQVDGVDIRQLTAAAKAGSVLGVDFMVDAEAGRIYIVEGGNIADNTSPEFDCEWTGDDANAINIASEAKIEGFLRFVGDPSEGPKYEAKLWNVSIQPDGDVGFISEDHASFKMKCTVKDDSINHPDFPLGQVIERSTSEESAVFVTP